MNNERMRGIIIHPWQTCPGTVTVYLPRWFSVMLQHHFLPSSLTLLKRDTCIHYSGTAECRLFRPRQYIWTSLSQVWTWHDHNYSQDCIPSSPDHLLRCMRWGWVQSPYKLNRWGVLLGGGFVAYISFLEASFCFSVWSLGPSSQEKTACIVTKSVEIKLNPKYQFFSICLLLYLLWSADLCFPQIQSSKNCSVSRDPGW